MKLSDIRPTLKKIGVEPSSTMGQNFLHDRNLASWIVGQLQVQPGETVLEIGPGMGALTEHLLEAGARVIAVEKDRKLAGYLLERFKGLPLEVRPEDAMDFDLAELWARGITKWIGNLPYYVSTPLIMRFGGLQSPLKQGIVMVQHEMAERICAVPRTADYGVPTVLLGSRWETRLIKRVGPGCFVPEPKVDSGILEMKRLDPAGRPFFDPARLDKMVRVTFKQRRKQMRKAISVFVSNWEEWCGTQGVSTMARPEELSVAQWIDLTRWGTTSHAQKPDEEWFDVVDSEDRVVDKKTRGFVHVNNLLHRAVHVFIFNRVGGLFLQLRSIWKDRHPGVWDSSAAGHLDSGEDYDACAVREAEEELGIRVQLTKVCQIGASERTGWEFVGLYEGVHDGPFELPAAEIETGLFFPVEVIARWIKERPEDFAPGFLECFEAWKRVNPHSRAVQEIS